MRNNVNKITRIDANTNIEGLGESKKREITQENKAVNAIILAGGENSRMQGEDKAFLRIEGRPIVEILLETLKPLVNKIIVVTNSPEKYNKYKVTLVADEALGKGPLMGIYSGLKASSAEYNFVIACDMPFLNEALVSYMIEKRDGYDALIPKIDDELHPLCGLYSKNCIPVIEEMLRQDRRDVRSIFSKLKVYFLERQELERIDRNLFSLANINTPEDFVKIAAVSRQ